MNVALGSIGQGLHVDVTELQWVVAGYSLTFGSLLLSMGALADRFGARRLFLAGLATFAVLSAACAAAPDGAFLVAARLLQGAAAAALVPTSLSLINTSYPDRESRARAIGVWGGMGGIAAVSGPLLGGLLITAAGWRFIFVVNIPVCLIAYLLIRNRITRDTADGSATFDVVGQLLAVAALALASYGVIEGGATRWPPATIGCVAAGLMLLALFGWTESRRRQAMFPVGLLRHGGFSTAIVTGLLLNFGFYGQLFVLSLYFRQFRGDSALVTGLLLAPQTATAIIGSTLGGRINARTGPRLPVVTGLVLGAAGFAALWVTGAKSPYLLLLGPMLAIGFGTSFTMPAATAAAVEAAPAASGGVTSGAFNASRQIGSVLGVAVLGGFIANGQTFIAGLHAAVTGAAVAFTGAALLNAGARHQSAPARGGSEPPRHRPGRAADAWRHLA